METLFKNQETLALFLIFFIPGFISLKVYDLLIPGERRDFSKSLFDAVAYSSLNFAALWWLIALVRNTPGWQLYAGMFVLLIAAPALWPVVLVQIRKWPLVAQRVASPNSRVWDDIFSEQKPYWVIVHLKDSRRIGGLYAGNSLASHSPAPPEIYLEQVWHLNDDGTFGSVVESTAGVLIAGTEILALEFFRYN